jgi:hypothetical protein
MNKFLLTVCAFPLGLLAIAPCAVQAQSVVLSAPTIACDSPAGVGCSGRTVLRPGTYRLGGVHNLSGFGSCHISGPGGSGYVPCRNLARRR